MNRRDWIKAGFAAGGLMAGRPLSGQSNDPTDWSLLEASERIRDRSISPVELTKACLNRIERLDPKLNAFITVTAERALEQAARSEAEQQRGEFRGPLHGIPVALKDLIDTAEIRTTAASELYADRVPDEDAEVVRRLQEAGAVLLGKLNMDEFAYNFTSETSHFGPIHNPWALDRTPGGSSGGSAVAVAAGLCFAALGSDTGGSIRQPAAFCNIAGLKPSYGLVSTRGAFPLAWSLDHLGPMCRRVADTAAVLQAIAGFDPGDPTSVDVAVPDFSARLGAETGSLRLGVARPFFFDDIDPEIQSAVNRAIELLGRMTAGVRDVELPEIGRFPVLAAEAYAYHEPYISKEPDSYHLFTRENILVGATISMTDYARARRRLDVLRRDADAVFDNVDLVITPTTPRPPIRLEEGRKPDVILLRNAIPMNIYDLPTISVPCGFTRAGLPIGLQISGRRLSEATVLGLAHAYEQATEWHRKKPAV